MSGYNLISLAGLIVLLGLLWLISAHRSAINWRVVVWGIGLQLFMALIIFVFPFGTKIFWFVNNVVVAMLDSANAGAVFVFGPLAIPPGGGQGDKSLGFILAFQALPTIVFFSALMAILYFYGIMPRIIRLFSWVFSKLMRISGAESLCAASNIFVGVESALTVKPYLERMTRSELCTVLAAGMATVSSNVLAVYVYSLQGTFPSIAGHLVTASFLSAPAALAASKMLMPETESPETMGLVVDPYYEKDKTLFETIITGANAGVKLIVGIVALLLAVLGLVALFDLLLNTAGVWLGGLFGYELDWSLRSILGILFYPVALLLGIPPADAGVAAQIIGERLIVTELTAYQDLNTALSEGQLVYERTPVIITYALCGFAHLASLAIFVGGVAAIAPKKREVLARVGIRALVAATFACLLTASVAGIFYSGTSLLLK